MRRGAIPAVALLGCIGFLMSQKTAALFSDTEAHRYKDAIHYVQDQGIVRGYPDGTYRPDQAINRAEFVKIIVEAVFPGPSGADCFPDVKNQWFAPFVCTAKNKGFVGGYPDGTFKPDRRVNFAEAAKIIVTAFTLPTVPDPVWYKPFTNALRERNAMPPSIAQLDQELSRGEMAAIIYALKGDGESAASERPQTTEAPKLVNGKTVEKRVQEASDRLHTVGSGKQIRDDFPDVQLVYTDPGDNKGYPPMILPFRYYYSQEADRTFNICNIDLTVFICTGKLDRVMTGEDVSNGRCVVTPVYGQTY